MKKTIYAFLILCSFVGAAQSEQISTLDFVQIQDENREEAIFYYENNWLELRKMAIERGYIDSYEMIEVEYTDDAPFHLILKTTYPDQKAFEKSEENFQMLIKENGPLQLMNDKKPGEFRKVIFSKVNGKHLF